VRALLEPRVCRTAALASAVSAAACLPRLWLWETRPEPLWFLGLVLWWGAFILWSFVVAWYPRYTGRGLWALPTGGRVWGIATGCGLLASGVLDQLVDPILRPVAPLEYPATGAAWAATVLFNLSFTQLFLVIAPYAVFMRLARDERWASGLTVLVGVLVVMRKTGMYLDQLGGFELAVVYLWRIAASLATVWLFRAGGLWVALWFVFLLQTRHLFH
jgi:hypothetical protein